MGDFSRVSELPKGSTKEIPLSVCTCPLAICFKLSVHLPPLAYKHALTPARALKSHLTVIKPPLYSLIKYNTLSSREYRVFSYLVTLASSDKQQYLQSMHAHLYRGQDKLQCQVFQQENRREMGNKVKSFFRVVLLVASWPISSAISL